MAALKGVIGLRRALRLVALTVVGLVLALGWLISSAGAFSTLDEACLHRAPPDVTAVEQTLRWWPPVLVCRYQTASGSRPVEQAEPVVVRIGGAVGGAVLAAGLLVLVARSSRPARKVSRDQ